MSIILCFTPFTVKRTAILANSTNRVLNAMTHNPIYDGPVYDSIAQSQFDTLPTNLKASADEQVRLNLSRPSGSDQNTMSENDCDNSGSMSPKRYVQHSNQAKPLLSNSICANFSAPSADIVNASESTQLIGIVAANNKVLNTLPTYSECTGNDGNLKTNEKPKSRAVKQTVSEELQSKDDEDSKYTVMEPIGAIAFSLDTHDN